MDELTYDTYEAYESDQYDAFATDEYGYEPAPVADAVACCCDTQPVVLPEPEVPTWDPAPVEWDEPTVQLPAPELAPLVEPSVALPAPAVDGPFVGGNLAGAVTPIESPFTSAPIVGGVHFDSPVVEAPLSTGNLVGGVVFGEATLVEPSVSTGTYVGGLLLGDATPMDVPVSTGNFVGGHTAAFEANQIAAREVADIAAVRNGFTNNAPSGFAGGQLPAPGLSEYQIREMHRTAQNAHETAVYGRRITNPYS